MRPTEADGLWQELVRSALLGTGRQPAEALIADAGEEAGALPQVMRSLAEREPEARLLAGAAVLAAYRRAGRMPRRDPRPLPEPAPQEPARRSPPAAGRHLAAMLAGEMSTVLPEWLAYAAAHDFVAPEELLPRLLDAGRSRAELREALLPVLGPRGRWLAAQNAGWAYAVEPADLREAWETGAAEVRLALLRRLRRSDPALALDLLRSTWEQEATRERAAFLRELRAGLGNADEPFLEAVLDDRRKEVRDAAAELLASLPSSQLVARMVERVRPRVRLEASRRLAARVLGGRVEVTVDPPSECTPEMVRDGINPKPPRGTGERAWWLGQMLAAVPPSLWTAPAEGLSPAMCIEAALRSEWSDVLLGGWSAAATRFRDAEWIGALIRLWAEERAQLEMHSLAAALPPERFQTLGLELLEREGAPLSASHRPLLYLAASPHPCGAALTRALIERLVGMDSPDWGMREALRTLALRLDPAAALDAAERLEALPAGNWLDILHFRHTMLEAFRT